MRAGTTEGLAIHVDDDRQQRASTLLKDVAYVIEARIELIAKARPDRTETVEKHLDMARRRARKGQYFHHPYLGTREFACDFELLEGEPPTPHESLTGDRDLGWMMLDMNYPSMRARFFRARMVDGVVEVPSLGDAGVIS
jgi:CRISPR-associated protein Cas5d